MKKLNMNKVMLQLQSALQVVLGNEVNIHSRGRVPTDAVAVTGNVVATRAVSFHVQLSPRLIMTAPWPIQALTREVEKVLQAQVVETTIAWASHVITFYLKSLGKAGVWQVSIDFSLS